MAHVECLPACVTTPHIHTRGSHYLYLICGLHKPNQANNPLHNLPTFHGPQEMTFF